MADFAKVRTEGGIWAAGVEGNDDYWTGELELALDPSDGVVDVAAVVAGDGDELDFLASIPLTALLALLLKSGAATAEVRPE